MNQEGLTTIKTVDRRPFKHLCMTIGNLPEAFVDSMSYYEALSWLVNYLETEVIPALNNNAEAVDELQDAFVELKNYVNNYFTNLDVQDEIDNKLDAMVTAGTFDEIINQQIFGELNNQVSKNTTDITDLETTVNRPHKMLVFGDSWSMNNYPYATNIWWKPVAARLHLEATSFAISGAGFTVENNLISTQVSTSASAITDPENVDVVFIFGGLNDHGANIQAPAEAVVQAVINQYPNAKVYLMGCNAYTLRSDEQKSTYALSLAACHNNPVSFIDALPFLLGLEPTIMFENNHPTLAGMNVIAGCVLSAMTGRYERPTTAMNIPGNFTFSTQAGVNIGNYKMDLADNNFIVRYTFTLPTAATTGTTYSVTTPFNVQNAIISALMAGGSNYNVLHAFTDPSSPTTLYVKVPEGTPAGSYIGQIYIHV